MTLQVEVIGPVRVQLPLSLPTSLPSCRSSLSKEKEPPAFGSWVGAPVVGVPPLGVKTSFTVCEVRTIVYVPPLFVTVGFTGSAAAAGPAKAKVAQRRTRRRR